MQISSKSQKILKQIKKENPEIKLFLNHSNSPDELKSSLKQWALKQAESPHQIKILTTKNTYSRKEYDNLAWKDFAAIRLLDYINYEGLILPDQNLSGKKVKSSPIKRIYLANKFSRGGASADFFLDFLYLFRQIKEKYNPKKISKSIIREWMNKYPAGYNDDFAKMQQQNRNRIIKILINKIEKGEIINRLFSFETDNSYNHKFNKMIEWWEDYRFHLSFAVRSPDLLNELLDYSLSPQIMNRLYKAELKGMPFFVNPYYLSLIIIDNPKNWNSIDQTIRDYIIYSKDLVDEFGDIVAWEKEDIVTPGQPNAAGWILPTKQNIHRRYPNVAILIPDTMGRACAGLCSTCQRMYDFQRGHLNFDYVNKKPTLSWPEKLDKLMNYFKNDSQLRDILITGGDALMSSNASLDNILNTVYKMAKDKKEQNKTRPKGEKYAEIVRIRLGTRLPVYLPQRIDAEMIEILESFKQRARKIGIKQFVIQTHIESPLEVTKRTKKVVEKLLSAGWIVTNQLVFTAAASRRGHTAKLRKVLNDIGVLTYYTFSTKGYKENYHHFATNARAVQEQMEEKCFGSIPDKMQNILEEFTDKPAKLKKKIDNLRRNADIDFLSTDRNMLNLPAVGKSLTFRTIGITRDGRRILRFNHDPNRTHSPIIKNIKNLNIIESKSVAAYLRQLVEFGENISNYGGIYGYSMGATEKRMPIYQYPEYDFQVTNEITNMDVNVLASSKPMPKNFVPSIV